MRILFLVFLGLLPFYNIVNAHLDRDLLARIFCTVFVVLGAFKWLVLNKRPNLPILPAIFGSLCILSFLTVSVISRQNYYHLAHYLIGVVCFYSAYVHRARLSHVFAWVGVGVALWGILNYMGLKWPFSLSYHKYQWMGFKNNYGIFLVLTFPFVCNMALKSKVWGLLCVIPLVACYLSGSRGSFIAIIVELLIVVWATRAHWNLTPAWLSMFCLIFIMLTNQQESAPMRVNKIGHINGVKHEWKIYEDVRLDIYKSAIKRIIDKPLGYGVGGFTCGIKKNDGGPHNLTLELIGTNPAIFLVFMLIFVNAIRKGYSNTENRIVVVALIGYFLNAQFTAAHNFILSTVYVWSIMGVCYAKKHS